jgi:hypothetical protein
MQNVNLKMTDSEGKTVLRTIDGLNAYSNGSECWELRGRNEQRKQLERWISERGNEQHATKLTLIDWYFG